MAGKTTKKSGKTKTTKKISVDVIAGKSFMYKPRPKPGRTPCPTGCGGNVKWNGGGTDYYFTCTKCDWTSGGLDGKKKDREEV